MTSLDSATQTIWDDMTERLETFLAAWEREPCPSVAAHAPAEPPLLRRLVLMELIKVDLEQRATKGGPRRLEDYLAEFPELREEGGPPVELIYEEYHVRRSHGEKVRLSEYRERFPQRYAALEKIAGSHDTMTLSVSAQTLPKHLNERFKAGAKVEDFELRTELGSGAFGRVFLAWQTSMQRLVALKVASKMGNEPQALAQFDHPHLVRVFDQRILPEDGLRLLYMQFCAGGTLAEVVEVVRRVPFEERRGEHLLQAVNAAMQRSQQVPAEETGSRRRLARTPWPEVVCRIGRELSSALAYAHRKGVYHRDVKPANVLLTAEGISKLADFNISFASNVVGATADAFFGGSLVYMSPEQVEAVHPAINRGPEELDQRADLYSLAVVLWELLYGERPFEDKSEGFTPTEMLTDMLDRRKEMRGPLRAHEKMTSNPIARRLTEVLKRCLAVEPQDRPASGDELSRELTLCLNSSSWDLLKSMHGRGRLLSRRFPVLMLVSVNFLPNGLAGAYNYWFNWITLIKPAGAEIHAAFAVVPWILNSILYSVGLGIGIHLTWPLSDVTAPKSLPSERKRFLRKLSLQLGGKIAVLAVSLWIIAGILFPLGMHLHAGSFPAGGYLHFALAQIVCGLIAAVFPFLGTTWLVVRSFYPALLDSESPDDDELRRLQALPQQAAMFFNGAGGVVLLAILLVLMLQRMNNQVDSFGLSVVLLVASLVGLGSAFYMERRIRQDVAALLTGLRPHEPGSETVSEESWMK